MNYFNLKDGKFVDKKNNISTDIITGTIENIKEFENEFQGKKIKSVVVYFKGKEFCLSFNKNSWFSWGFFNSVRQINFSQDINIKVYRPNDSKITFCNVEQNGIIKKEDFIPKPEKLEINGMKISNWDKPGLIITDYINNRVSNQSTNNSSTDLPF